MKKSQKGFTIIEVALVLAVGAMIFLVVFLAVPALQRNSRNDARKRDVSSIVEAIADYNANNPTKGFKTGYAYQYDTGGDLKKDDSLGKYLDTLSTNTTLVNVKSLGSARMDDANVDNSNTIFVYPGYKCDGNEALQKGAARSAAVVGIVENAADYSHYCSDAN